ncbi:D-methionine transport system permease protein MetI [Nocardioides dokdonensis FR1436]|uniref:D-methionine transport system permease protein MetI n=1 Tax=Nocardioides dokdonensis FR1436 TaxID=1300347 RepID=A0A1A9GGV8_9ACTN|nr:ABC transporter permease subunit [Nocardioides dokdonensis]ANH36761.1 D-methionine transport system permease protein MetI [Nocardioides dokdonensis FR1436]
MDRLVELDSLFAEAALETLYIVALTLGIGGLGGLLLGVLLYTTRGGGIAANRLVHVGLNLVVNFFRPIPFIIFIAAAQPLARMVVGVGIGNRAIIFALSLAATFGISRIVEQNLVSVDPGVIEASRAMGAGRLRTILTVLLPEALGPLILGYTFALVAIVDMSAVAGVVGGGGLGAFALTYGYRQFDPVVTWAAVLVIIAFVQMVQFAGNRLARSVMRR